MLIKVLIKKCYLEEACLREGILHTFLCTSKPRVRDGDVLTPGFFNENVDGIYCFN